MALLALAVLGLLLVWSCGSVLARIAGGVLVVGALLRMVMGDTGGVVFVLFAAGVLSWLVGHWLYALKFRVWRNTLALWAFSVPGLSLLAPISTNRRPRHTHTPHQQWIAQQQWPVHHDQQSSKQTTPPRQPWPASQQWPMPPQCSGGWTQNNMP